MAVTQAIPGATNEVLQEALTEYSDEAYTDARRLSGTDLVGSNPNIDTSTETFIGQVRWDKPLTPVINVASITDATDGVVTTTSTDFLRYIKTVRTHGADDVNIAKVITQRDGLAKIGRDFGKTRATDEHNAILSVLKGVMTSELLNGAAAGSGATGLGGQTFENDPEDKRYGFYVDLGAAKTVVAASTTTQGAARAEGFLQAFGMAYKDYEPAYAYLLTSPETMASLRSANLVDQTRVQDGNVEFETIFDGKFRILQTRATQSLSAAETTKANTGAGVDLVGLKTSFIVLPGAIAMESLDVPFPVEIERKASSYMGGGKSSIWRRWGYVLAPAGYDWDGDQTNFPSDADYASVKEGATQVALTGVGSATLAATTGVFARKATSALSLGILPIFHS